MENPLRMETVELWTTSVQSDTIVASLPLPLEALTGRKPRTSLPQIPSSIGKTVETSRIRNELIRQQPSTSTHSPMELEPGQPVFIKKVQRNVWKTGIIVIGQVVHQ